MFPCCWRVAARQSEVKYMSYYWRKLYGAMFVHPVGNWLTAGGATIAVVQSLLRYILWTLATNKPQPVGSIKICIYHTKWVFAYLWKKILRKYTKIFSNLWRRGVCDCQSYFPVIFSSRQLTLKCYTYFCRNMQSRHSCLRDDHNTWCLQDTTECCC